MTAVDARGNAGNLVTDLQLRIKVVCQGIRLDTLSVVSNG